MRIPVVLLFCLAMFQFQLAADERVLISEFLASNVAGKLDRDGDHSDWIELYNSTGATVNLGGWHLTDDVEDLTKWTLPATNLGPGKFLLVFASGKNRAVPGVEPHTNFQLDSTGEYLALVRPDGVTVEFAYAPTFPPQEPDISFGALSQTTITPFVADGRTSKWRIPASAADWPADWASTNFDDSAWASGLIPVGFDAGQVIGGGGGGTTNLARGKTATQSSTLSTYSANLAVDGNLGNLTHTAAGVGLPATWEVNLGTNAAIEEIVIYNRGDGCCASRLRDITVRILSLDGTATNFTSALLNPENALGGGGIAGPATLTINLTSLTGSTVSGGRVRITRTPDPDLSGTGGQGNADEANVLSLGEVVVTGFTAPLTFKSIVRTDLQATMLGVNASALLRVPFLVVLENLPVLDLFTLRMKYDDGFVAYLNGVKVAEANAPGGLSWNSAATAEHADAAALQFEEFNLTSQSHLLQDGINVLAIQGLNRSAADDDFLIAPELSGRSVGLNDGLYFTQPTPGSTNVAGTTGLVADTKFSVDRGFFNAPFAVAITTATVGSEIRYTTNGSAPSAVSGVLYNGPIQISRTTVLRAIATKPGFTPSNVDTHSYVFLDQVVAQSFKSTTNAGYPTTWSGVAADYAMDPRITTNASTAPKMIASLRSLPSVFFSTSISNLFDPTRGFYSHPTDHGVAWERPVSMEMVATNGATEFQEDCGLRIQGGYFRDPNVTQKHSLRVLFKAQYGVGKLRHNLFHSDDAVTEFDTLVLRAGANDGYSWDAAKDTEQFTRNRFGGDLNAAMGHPSPHGLFVHVYFNGIYWGLFEVCERPNEDFSASYFGGDPLEWDSNNAGDVKNGDLTAWNAFNSQTAAAKTTAAYQRVQGNNPDGSRNATYPVYLDKLNYIDYMMANIWGGNWDWPNKNFWFGRLRTTNSTGFKFYMWDFENTMGNNRDRSPVSMVSPRSGTENSWVGQPHFYLKTVAEYKMDFADRVQSHFFNGGILTPNALIKRYRDLADHIELSIFAETARWGDDNLNPPQDIEDWRRERDWMLGTYLPQRSDVVFKQFRAAGLYPALSAPNLSQFGGTVLPGFSLTLSHTNAAGQIYFTVNGADPRLPGGALAPYAQLYTSPIPINGTTFLRARVINSTNWSAIVEAPFTTTDYFRDLVISEFMYNPADDPLASGDEYEFLELKNRGAGVLELGGLSFVSGISFGFTNGTPLAPGGTFLLVRNLAAFQARYPGVAVNGVYSGTLANSGETLSISHILLGAVLSLTFDDELPWPLAPDGHGFSLVLAHPGAGDDPNEASSWRASAALGGSPGADEPAYFIPPVVINEVMTRGGASPDYIELHNPTAADASIGGWFLTDDPGVPKKYRFANGTSIMAGGFLVVTEAEFNSPGSAVAFRLDAGGDDVYLFSGNANTNLTGYSQGFRFGSAAEGVSFGRHVISTGGEDFPAQINPTPGAKNSGPRVGPVVITEIQYHPNPADDEFIEIRNISSTVQLLFDPAHPTNHWRLNGVSFEFPPGTTLEPGQFAVVTGGDPAAFRSRHAVPGSVLVLGPFVGKLQDSGELIELQRPDAPGATSLDFITMDAVRYNDHGGWPSAADGAGPSLQRINGASYGNDPANWVAARSTPGAPWAGGGGPAITSQPQNRVTVASNNTTFQVIAIGGEPLSYQWQFNGEAIPGATFSTLLLTSTQPAQAGRYRAVVFGGGGSAVSADATLTVLVPATITAQPRSALGLLGSNISFTISASSSTPVAFQWRFNGMEILNATASTLTLKGLTFQDAGNYTCVITDAIGPIESQSATLTVVVRAVLTQPPQSLEVPVGGTAIFSVAAEGTLPLSFRWRKNSLTITNMVLNQKVAFYTIPNVQAASAGTFTVTVTNIGGAATTSAGAILTVLADADLDGIPDGWEIQHGLNPNNPADAGLDPDGDTMSNWAEYIAGTDPADGTSYLKVDHVEGIAGAVALEFMARSNRTYSVQYRPTPTVGAWQILANLPARSSNRLERVVDPSPPPAGRYYRLRTPAITSP